MTEPRRDGIESPFSAWFRRQKMADSRIHKIYATDIDFIHGTGDVHILQRYAEPVTNDNTVRHFMLFDLKCFNAPMRKPQRETYGFLEQFLWDEASSQPKMKNCHTGDGDSMYWVDVWFWGVHNLTLSTDDPRTSDKILWDGNVLEDEAELVEILAFRRQPTSHKEPMWPAGETSPSR
jgi:hypothetical protein